MATQKFQGDPRDGELDLFEVFSTLWAGRWFIILTTALFTSAGVAYALLATQWYQADTVLVQVDSKSMSSSLAQLGGLASLAGINITGNESGQAPVAVLKSRDFATAFIEQEKLLPVLFADKWDAGKGQWKDSNPKKQPDIRDAVRYFEKTVRAVSEDKKTGLVTLSITWKDSTLSATWANLLVKLVNQRLREQALAEAERNIAYLRSEMAATNVPSLQQSIGKVLEQEMQKLLMARGREEYAFKIIDHATPPKYRVKPQRPVVALSALLLGGVFSAFLVLVRKAKQKSRRLPATN